MSMQDINREARAWEAQLRAQGLRRMDAYRIAQSEAGWRYWALDRAPSGSRPSQMVRAGQPRSPQGPGRAGRCGRGAHRPRPAGIRGVPARGPGRGPGPGPHSPARHTPSRPGLPAERPARRSRRRTCDRQQLPSPHRQHRRAFGDHDDHRHHLPHHRGRRRAGLARLPGRRGGRPAARRGHAHRPHDHQRHQDGQAAPAAPARLGAGLGRDGSPRPAGRGPAVRRVRRAGPVHLLA